MMGLEPTWINTVYVEEITITILSVELTMFCSRKSMPKILSMGLNLAKEKLFTINIRNKIKCC
jgi:hypothetical protein